MAADEGLLDDILYTGAPARSAIADLIGRALDPDDPGVGVLGWPGRRLVADPAPGDLVVRHGAMSQSSIGVVFDPALLDRTTVTRRRLTGDFVWPGQHLRVIGAGGPDTAEPTVRRIAGPDGFILPDTYILRPRFGEADLPDLPPPTLPTIRRGSSGPAVAEAQARLNAVHARLVAEGSKGLDRCPLVVDGAFGSGTFAAVVAFQKLAFPGDAHDWDGVVGPKTWAQLQARGREPPSPPPGPLPDPNPPGPPIIPVVLRPLQPGRWGPILSAAKSADANLRSGNAVRALIDGAETFRIMVDEIRAAQGEHDYVYLLGWDMTMDPSFELIPGDPASTVARLLEDASKRGVQVRMMLWAKPVRQNIKETAFVNGLTNGAAIRDDETPHNSAATVPKVAAALVAAGISPVLIPIIVAVIKPSLAALTGAHHQKVLIVRHGEILAAYCGGIDLNANRLQVVDPTAGHPHHDDHCRIVGPSAFDLLQTFIKRWRHHPDSGKIDAGPKGPLRGASEPIPAPLTTPSPQDSPFGGTCSVVIARTFTPLHSVPGVGKERDIKALLLTAIANAQTFIYLEDQYLIDLDTAAALNKAIPRLAQVTILITGTQILTQGVIPDLPFGGEYRRDFVDRMISGLSSSDLAKVGVFQLSTSQSSPTFGRHTYVHAKSWVFDDELAVIGSANCNRRGYLHDSEVDAFIFDDPPPQIFVATRETEPAGEAGPPFGHTWAQSYRIALWKEHLGVPAAAVEDGVVGGLLWRVRPPSARVLPFSHVLPSTAKQFARDLGARALRDIVDPVP
jgi:phosphatidylserine/phosphatidylglycerophosphate/cardiolipin synthase-like enzyme